MDCIIYDSPKFANPLDPELPLLGHLSSLQMIFSVREMGKPNYLGAREPVLTHWDLDLLDSLLQDYITDGSSHVSHKGALQFPTAINQYLCTEQANNTLLGPFPHNPSSPLNSIPKQDSEEHRVILVMSFPMGTSINDGIDKDKYLGVAIELAYPTIDAFATMVKAVGPGALMYKWDLCRAYRQIWMDPFDVPYWGFFWEGAFYFDTVLVMGCTSSTYICQRVTTTLAHIYNSWGGTQHQLS